MAVQNSERCLLIRILWAFIFILYCWMMTKTLVTHYRDYQRTPVNFLAETTYLDWNITFPAVTVCQAGALDVPPLVERLMDDRDNIGQIEFFITDLLYFSGICYSCQTMCYTCPKLNISQTAEIMRKPCPNILAKCKWNGVDFNCCEQFLPIETEYGICFAINSLHTRMDVKDRPNLIVNSLTGVGELFVETLNDVKVYFHSPEDVPFINSETGHSKEISFGETYEILFNVIEIDNDDSILELPVDRRGCRYPWEVPSSLKVHSFYSYSACVVQCRAENEVRLCNCTHHLMPYYNKKGHCDYDSLKCLTENFEILNTLIAKGSDKPGLDCDCIPSCTEPEYNVVASDRLYNQSTSGIYLKMKSLPSIRYKRVVEKNMLDLVVSIGGIAGLFIGASLLTIVEIVYTFCFKW